MAAPKSNLTFQWKKDLDKFPWILKTCEEGRRRDFPAGYGFSPARVCLEGIHCSQSQTGPWLPEQQTNQLQTWKTNDKIKLYEYM